MKYQEFLQTIEKEIRKQMEPGFELHVQSFSKNNGITYDGLVIFHPKYNISPTIYLNPYYQWYLDGVAIEDICSNIMATYQQRLPNKDFDTSFFTDYKNAKSAIIMKLINYEHNIELLQKVPHFRYLDFAVVFQCLVNTDTESLATILIHNHHLDFWSVTPDELFQAARNNTPLLLPYHLENMEDLLKEYMYTISEEFDPVECPMYILTNHAKLNGATVILYEGLLHQLATEFDSDFIILPSSIHEVLLVPVHSPEHISFFSQMVTEVNETQLADDERLSDHAYYYSRNTKQVYIPEYMNDMSA